MAEKLFEPVADVVDEDARPITRGVAKSCSASYASVVSNSSVEDEDMLTC